jgi:hypothetical protein
MHLTPSQRVALIKEISQRLVAEEWPIVDVTLSQFGLPTADEWQSSKDAYVLEMIKQCFRPVIGQPRPSCWISFRVSPPGIDPPFWRKGMLRLFVSHLARHRAYTTELQEALLRLAFLPS